MFIGICSRLRWACTGPLVLWFLFLLQIIDCGYLLEPPWRGSNLYAQSMFWAKIRKIFYWIFFFFFKLKNLCILHGFRNELIVCIVGLVHKSQISKSRVEDPSEMFTKGEMVYCKVISIDVSEICFIVKALKVQKFSNNISETYQTVIWNY